MKKKLGISILLAVTCMLIITGCTKKADTTEYMRSVDEITIADDVRIVALGEATHGNAEFQELKLDIFKHLVETTNIRGLALEGDFAGCAIANAYIQNGEGTAEDGVKLLGYQIYRTDQMLELVEWMHDYNETAEERDQVRLYGFDMQRDMPAKQLIMDYYEMLDTADAEMFCGLLDTYYGTEENVYDESCLTDMKNVLNEIIIDLTDNEDKYAELTGSDNFEYALRAAECMLQNTDLHSAGNNYNEIRDRYMKENVEWILEREENIFASRLMLSGHNGHIAKAVNSTYTNMGSYLFDELGAGYMAIGTDFYKTECNIAENEGRGNHSFCSDDPLAASVKNSEETKNYLSFFEAKDSDSLKKIIENPMKMGSLGESYSPVMKYMKVSYQINMVPEQLYDGMIFVYEATPITVWDVD